MPEPLAQRADWRVRRWRPNGIRAQSTLVAVVVLTLALLIGSGALLEALHLSLSHAARRDLELRANEAATVVSQHGPQALFSDASQSITEGITVQVTTESGALAFNSSRNRATPVALLRPGPGQVAVSGMAWWAVSADEDDLIVVAVGTVHNDNQYTVLAADTQQTHYMAIQSVGLGLLISLPILIGLAGLATWILVGRTLRPVEAIRSQVQEISAAQLDSRVTVPATRDEVAALAATMNAMLARLEHSQKSQRRFIADASHELRSPLATLSASLELVETDRGGDSWAELSPLMTSEVQRLRELVDGMLLLARADDSALAIKLTEVDLDDLVQQEGLRLRTGTELNVEIKVQPVRTLGDEGQLIRVLRNLADNAARAATSRIRLTVHPAAGGAVILVEDDGSGVPQAERSHIFDRFVRLDDARTRAVGGSGLGLAIVKEIVTAHHGRVEVSDSSLGGACFSVELPGLASTEESR